MPAKIKVSPEEKVRLVCEYMSGHLSASEFARQYKTKDQVLYDWVRLYQTRGAEGLIPASRFRKYSPELKIRAVRDYLDGAGSLRALCTKYDISDDEMLRRWVKWYNSHGDFKQPSNGGVIYMAKGRSTTLDERIEIVSHCIASNKDYGKTIERYGVSYQQVYGWVRKYEKDGPDGLADRRGKRKVEAAMSEVEKLRAQLKLKEAENLRLQMENELLKKLEALERGQDTD
jgi:transposase-like protein